MKLISPHKKIEGKPEDHNPANETLWRVLDVQLDEDLRYKFLKKNVYVIKKDTVKPKHDLRKILLEDQLYLNSPEKSVADKNTQFQKYVAKRVEVLSRTQSMPDFISKNKSLNNIKIFPKRIKIERPQTTVNIVGNLDEIDKKNANTRIVTYQDLATNLNRDIILAENYMTCRDFNSKSKILKFF